MAYLPTTPSVSTNNSSTTTLLANAIFTGTSEDVTNYREMRVSIISDVASATDGLSLQQSSNGTNWDVTDTYTITAATGKTFVVPRDARFFRIIYTNGATNQTSFRLQAILNPGSSAPSSQRASDGYTNETDLEQVWAFNSVWNGTTWDRAITGNGTTTTGTQRVTLSSDSTGQVKLAAGANAIGSISNTSFAATQSTAAALTAGWPTINGEANDVTGTFTNATQTTSVTASSLDGYGNTLISINGTYGTATAIFEGSDDSGTTWYTVQAARDNTNVIETGYTGLTNISQTWQINNPGFDSLRVRSTAVASGTVNVRLSSSAAPVASGTIVGIGTAIPAGTNVIGHVIADTGSTTAVTQATGTNLHMVLDSGTVTAVTAITNALPAGTNLLGKTSIDQTTPGTTNLVAAGQNGTWTVQPGNTPNTTPWLIRQKSATSTNSSVASSATSVTILASNANRIAASIYNDSTQILYLSFTSSATTTAFKVPLAAATYYEVPGGYSGVISGIWASANGNARVAEET